MVENIKRISNPLTIVAIFAALAEIASTAALTALDKQVQATFVWFMMGFPTLLVVLFFFVLVKHPRALYAPSDYRSDESFLKGFDKGAALLVQKPATHTEHSSGDAALLLQKLGDLANLVGEQGRRSFSASDRDSIMTILRALHKYTDTTNTLEFAEYLEKVIDTFAGAGLDKNIDTIESQYRDVIRNRGGIVQTLIQHYGMRVLGHDAPSEDTRRRFLDYVALAKDNNLSEIALPFYFAFSHAEKNSDAVTKAISEAQHLDSDEKETLTEILEKFSDPESIAVRSTPTVATVARKFQDFRSQYSNQLDGLL